MKCTARAITLFATLLAASGVSASDFSACVDRIGRDAVSQGVSKQTVATSLQGVHQLQRVLERDQRQPEFSLTFWHYLDSHATERRVARGRELLRDHHKLLTRIQARYHVQPPFLISLWGMETSFGDDYGKTPVLDALTTLACDPRRSDFFTGQVLDALRIIDEGSIPADRMLGSWAGAMGNTQFMPSTFLAHAVDFDGDGRRDLWNSVPDALASAARYLHDMGWDGHQRWGREVRLPQTFAWRLAGLERERSVNEWRRLGVRDARGGALPASRIPASLLLPQGADGPAFLVYPNFRRLMRWNTSTLYALTAGHLADRIAGLGHLRAARAHATPLRSADVREIQELLNHLGFDSGTPDGVIGRRTRAATRAFQLRNSYPADGYPDRRLLTRLRAAAGTQMASDAGPQAGVRP